MGIDKRLLCHSCVMKRYHNGIAGRTLISSVTLLNVRIVPSRECFSGKAQRERRFGTLYYDTEHSLPQDTEILTEGTETEIEWNGKSYPVTGISYVYARDSLHHLEIALGG